VLKLLIDSGPPWSVGVIAFLIILIVTKVGFHAGLWRSRQPDFESDAQISSITGAHISLLAFILAFTFNMAAGHFNERKQLLVQDVSAIETAYAHAGLLQSEEGRDIQALLRNYVSLISDPDKDFEASQALITAEDHLSQIWNLIDQRASQDKPLGALENLFIRSFSQVDTLHRERVIAASQSRIPSTIWNGLIVMLVLSMAGMGYFSGIKGRRSPIASTALALSFATVIFLIVDLDRPREGSVNLNLDLVRELGERLDGM
jgi:hypothetical protein